ncbi:MAG: extracellular solute-binding protein [Chloroflexi bacterium]|nr:extracellular solute-binding protein [Chloroflexota bacterium]MCI0577984.1 extracellular solute-binding protein [Chloroflexota bacterium]MCI0648094.1 extracellular solute-binding protein [Chloroflexota bacterium]MCI0729246.1 extracellular solute-binding protein [Chloroflexota bacterium]
MLRKKSIQIVVLLLLLSLLLVACGGAGEEGVGEEEATPVEQVETPEEAAEPAGPGEVQTITLVARCKAAPPHEDGRCNNLVAAAEAANQELEEMGDNRRIQVEAIQDNKDWGEYKTEFELASDAGEAPDIIVSGHEHIGDWAPAGIIIPVDDRVGEHEEFADIIDSLWDSVTFEGQRWGIPQDAEARPLFYSKTLLRELGWSDEEIESLDERIASGEFTWEDMLDTAEQAVEQGIVQPGNGWWHRPVNGPDFLYYYYAAGGEISGEGDQLVFDRGAALQVYQILEEASQERNILSPSLLGSEWANWNTAVSDNQVLFWYGGSWNWADWAVNYVADRGGEEFLFENIGFAPIPALEAGKGEPITLTHPLVYMISSQSEHPDLAMLLIAKATVKELNTEYAVASGHLGILESQVDYEPYVQAQFLSQVLPLLEYTTFLPNSPYWSQWSEAYYLGIQAVESGDLSAEEAVDVVVDQLQNELGDSVIISE